MRMENYLTPLSERGHKVLDLIGIDKKHAAELMESLSREEQVNLVSNEALTDPRNAQEIVFLLDDHELVREGIRQLLESDEEIEVVGEDVSAVDFHFSVGANFPSRFGRGVWFGPAAAQRLQYLLFRTPLVHAFILGSATYHDRVWWPLKGRAVQARVRRESKWGRLFDEY